MRELERALTVEDVVGRTLEGTAVTYGRPYRVSDDGGATYYREQWEAGAFAASITASRNTFEFRRSHADERLGIVSFTDEESRLAFTATVDDSDEGEQALEQYHRGTLRGVSLRFRPRRHAPPDERGVLVRLRADIRELSLTNSGQYGDAKVLVARNAATLQTIERMLVDGQRVLDYSRLV